MKTVDTVDKSGLPVAAGGVELTEKDLHCAAHHIEELIRRHWRNEEDGPDACELCPLVNECLDENRTTHPWETFKKLFKITGAKTSEVRKPKKS